jgi:glycine/D-amino acid oxidase-like deaminating enzyme
MIIHDSDGYVVNRIDMVDTRKAHGSPMYQGKPLKRCISVQTSVDAGRHGISILTPTMPSGHRAQYLGVFGVEARMLGVEVVPYSEVIDILDNLDRPACITADGRVFHGDVVLVADGCNSSLRNIVFGTPSKESCTGYGIHRAITRVTDTFRNDPRCARRFRERDAC